MSNGYLLDACAIIAYINDEEGADVVDDLFARAFDGDVLISMSSGTLLS